MKRLLIALGVLIFIACLLVFTRLIFSFRELRRSIQAEPAFTCAIVDKVGGAKAVLTACRELLETFSPNENQLYREVSLTNSLIPQIVKKMRLSAIYVSKDYVLISLEEPGRISLLAFREGATPFGSLMITNGLWYWNGTPSKETRAASLADDEKTKSYYEKIK